MTLKKQQPKKYFKMRISRAMEMLGPEVYKNYIEQKEKFWAGVKPDDRDVIRKVKALMTELDFNDEQKLKYLANADGNYLSLKICQLAGHRDRMGEIANEYLTDANFIYRFWKNKYMNDFTPAKIEAGRKARVADEKLYKEDIEAEAQAGVWELQLMEVIVQEFGNYLLNKCESIEIMINALKDRRKELERERRTPDTTY